MSNLSPDSNQGAVVQASVASGHRWPDRNRLIVVSFALLSLFLAWIWMAIISPTDPWYRNLDMNIHNTDDALSINSGVPPVLIDQPAVPLKYLLALDFRIRHYMGFLPVWNIKKFGDSKAPLREIPPLIRMAGSTAVSLSFVSFFRRRQ